MRYYHTHRQVHIIFFHSASFKEDVKTTLRFNLEPRHHPHFLVSYVVLLRYVIIISLTLYALLVVFSADCEGLWLLREPFQHECLPYKNNTPVLAKAGLVIQSSMEAGGLDCGLVRQKWLAFLFTAISQWRGQDGGILNFIPFLYTKHIGSHRPLLSLFKFPRNFHPKQSASIFPDSCNSRYQWHLWGHSVHINIGSIPTTSTGQVFFHPRLYKTKYSCFTSLQCQVFSSSLIWQISNGHDTSLNWCMFRSFDLTI